MALEKLCAKEMQYFAGLMYQQVECVVLITDEYCSFSFRNTHCEFYRLMLGLIQFDKQPPY